MKTIKILTIGRSQSGKTLFLDQLCNANNLDNLIHYRPTVDDIFSFNLEYEKGNIDKVQFYDTANFIELDQNKLVYYMGITDAVLYFYNISLQNRDNLELLFIKEDLKRVLNLKKDCLFIVIGTLLMNNPNSTFNKDLFCIPTWIFKEKINHHIICLNQVKTFAEPLNYLFTLISQNQALNTSSSSFVSKKAKSFISDLGNAVIQK